MHPTSDLSRAARLWRLALRTLTLVTLLFVSTACFDIEEEITLKKDGSGTYQISVDMTQMMEMMSGFMTEEQMAESDMFGSMDSALQVQVETLREMDGLSNVRHMSENFRFSLTYDFADIDALNAAASAGSAIDNTTGPVTSGASYKWTPKSFERENKPIDNLLNSEDEEQAEAMEMAKMMLADAHYSITYHFPGKVKKLTNDAAEIGADNRSVILSSNFLDILDGEAELGNKITFKKR
ncbi:MAG: hypothetical protein D6722_03180 [Bacteroidetes bacterium]|nr:MAG: hypothetical protein D6722_03180 [Bacteroidota bacterium]